MKKRHKVIQEHNVEDFETAINTFADNNDVFATQTHMTNREGAIVYTAVVFFKDYSED